MPNSISIKSEKVELSAIIPSLKDSNSDKPVTLKQLKSCYSYLALLIKSGNNEVLPLFERLHREIESRKRDHHIKQIAMNVAEEKQN
jgi:hypothetical protein